MIDLIAYTDPSETCFFLTLLSILVGPCPILAYHLRAICEEGRVSGYGR